ncbi:hypothetical protein HDV02_002922 [Globomyces sp. JEL0801]|nr:hypothetical protein HDV02_002922 [Globomyces sp. JEL0801]
MERMNVKQSAEWVTSKMENVRIVSENLEAAADLLLDKISEKQYSQKTWKQHNLHPQTNDESTVDWIFLIDLLNFSFWNERSPKKRFTVTFNGVPYTGYWSLCATIQRCLLEGIPITSPSYYATATTEELKHALRPDDYNEYDEMPLIDLRIQLLQEAGNILVTKFNGSFVNCIRQCNGSAQELINLIISNFGHIFDDSLLYHGVIVSFHKRVQILVADLWACGTFGTFNDISTITMLADYRVPQALLYFKVLEYLPDLMSTLKKHEQYHRSIDSNVQLNSENMLQRGHPYEIEIRAASIHVVELLVGIIKSKIDLNPDVYTIKSGDLNAIILDFYLWDIAKEQSESMAHLPIHLTRTIYY